MPKKRKRRRTISDAAALQEIYELMESAHEWDSDTTSAIEAIILKTGREFTDKDSEEFERFLEAMTAPRRRKAKRK